MRRIAVASLTLLLSVQSCSSDGSRDASAVTAVEGRASLAAAAAASGSQASSFKGAWTITLFVPPHMMGIPSHSPIEVTLECDLLPNGTGTCGRGKDATPLVYLETPLGMNMLVNLTGLRQDLQFLITFSTASPVQLYGGAGITGLNTSGTGAAGAVRR